MVVSDSLSGDNFACVHVMAVAETVGKDYYHCDGKEEGAGERGTDVSEDAGGHLGSK